jgi:hypothetical protein
MHLGPSGPAAVSSPTGPDAGLALLEQNRSNKPDMKSIEPEHSMPSSPFENYVPRRNLETPLEPRSDSNYQARRGIYTLILIIMSDPGREHKAARSKQKSSEERNMYGVVSKQQQTAAPTMSAA